MISLHSLLGKQKKVKPSQVNLWTSIEIYSTMFSRENIKRILGIIKENNLIKDVEINKKVLILFETGLKNYEKNTTLASFLKNNLPRLIEEIESKNYNMGYSHTEIEQFEKLSLVLKNVLNQL